MLEMTGSALLVGLITTALFLPRLLLTVPAGWLADVVDRRSLLAVGFVTCSAAAAALAVSVTLDQLTPGLLLLLTFVLGTGSALAKPAQHTFLPDMVEGRLRAQAITLNSSSHQVTRIVGPSLGGIFIALGRADVAFLLNAFSFLVVLVVLLSAPSQDAGRGRPDAASERGAVLAGLRYVRENVPIRQLLVLTAAFVLWAVAVQALLPNLAADRLQLDATGYGVLYSIFGVGSVLGALTRERLGRRLPDGAVACSMVLFGLSTVVVALSQSVMITGLALLLVGTTWVWTMTTLNATIQLASPAWVRSRVIALFVLAVAAKPIGAALAGVLAELAGIAWALGVAGGAAALVGILARRYPLSGVRLTEGDTAAAYTERSDRTD